MLAAVIRLCLISQLCLHGLVASANTRASAAERANLVFDFFTFGRPHKHTKDSLCERTDWRKKSLKLIKEIPFAGVFRDLHGETKFEASGLVRVNNTYYVVFDR